ncbi:transcription termination/antitermination NusG family protein [Rhodopseudomonas telluris]|uniref:Transcription termination/antitermination NusG family protein n=1 Tax=Rhodopseudomonas telluris TaxID=644215 RepID=A0ABV6EW12_9BRAD
MTSGFIEADVLTAISSADLGPVHSRRWYVGHTLPRKEQLARTHLERQGFETFLPQLLAKRSHARKVETIKSPMFPRYIFVRLDPSRDRWRSVNGTMGMAHLVATRDQPCPVPTGFVEDLQRSADGDVISCPTPRLMPGDSVGIRSGPFAGHIGTLLSVGPNGRIEMLLAMLNGSVRLTVAQDLLEIAV